MGQPAMFFGPISRTDWNSRNPAAARTASPPARPDIEIIRESGSSIAHCPKSNAKFGHGYAPFEKFLDSNIAVGLGSDSVASNNSCDMLEEARFAAFAARNRADKRRFVTAEDVLHSVTLGGAESFGPK